MPWGARVWRVQQSWFCLTQGWLAGSQWLANICQERGWPPGWSSCELTATLRGIRCTCPVKGSGVRRHHYNAPVCTRASALRKHPTRGRERAQAWKSSAAGAVLGGSLSPPMWVYGLNLNLSSCPWPHTYLSTFRPTFLLSDLLRQNDPPITFV